MSKIGRNDPCPCGSGKKYKHCHGAPLAAVPDDPESHDRAIERAVGWLVDRHRKAFKAAFDELLDDLWPADAEGEELDDELWATVQMNVTEWLLAEGEIDVRGHWEDIHARLLGPHGPAWTPGQRRFIEQLGCNPLRLYTVTEVRRGEGLTLVDAFDAEAPPLFVHERSGSETAQPGMLIGARVLDLGAQRQLSGAVYTFSMLAAPAVLEAVRAAAESVSDPEDRAMMVGIEILRAWLRQHLLPMQLPQIVDAASGEAILLVTDHYRVLDEAALAAALETAADVRADAGGGWSRARTDDDGVTRPLATVSRGRQPDRVDVFYRTQALADEGRAWFEQTAGPAVQFLARELSDPASLIRHGGVQAPAGSTAEPVPPEAMAQLIGQALRRSYARWADEPIPALGGKTPRQAIATPAGLERVKGLLRSYEAGEQDMARDQGRPEISYQFLWDQLGIER